MTSSGTLRSSAPRRALNGRHVLLTFIAFFVIVFAVNGFMIYQAVSTFGGVDNADAYREGLAYNQRIARDAEQSLQGWQDEIDIVPSPQRLRVRLNDRSGSAVAGKRLVATLERPATNRFDLTLTLSEQAPGTYEAPIPTAHEGTWIADISAFQPGVQSAPPAYEARRRLWIAR